MLIVVSNQQAIDTDKLLLKQHLTKFPVYISVAFEFNNVLCMIILLLTFSFTRIGIDKTLCISGHHAARNKNCPALVSITLATREVAGRIRITWRHNHSQENARNLSMLRASLEVSNNLKPS